MRGKHRIVVQNKRIRYDFSVKRNITVLCGDSATGKTTLIDMIREYFENGEKSAVDLLCDKQCAVLEGRTWIGQLSEIQDSIVFIDEGNDFVVSEDFALAVQKSDNYYVIVTREGISTLPYSVEEIYGIRNSGKYGSIKRTYNEFYHLYSIPVPNGKVKPDRIITEDSNSGFQFFEEICRDNNRISCISANGKSNVFKAAAKQAGNRLLVIADGAAFGPEMDKLMALMRNNPNLVLYLPESFEWLLLKSGLLEMKEIEEVLEHPEDQIESSEFFSWERYFTAYLVRATRETYLQYNKRQLNPAYLQKKIVDKVLNAMQGIELHQ
ncbi:MAG: translation initiation factor 2 [Lachnospiraceae bacterium]|nr:translation initiation factor 2 [Lachnospiraceae bacterium]